MRKNVWILSILLLFLTLSSCIDNTKTTTLMGTTTAEKQTTTNDSTTTEPSTKMIKDMAGRDVIVPLQIDAVFSNIASGTMMIYTINPDLLVGWNYQFNDDEVDFIVEDYRNLPAYGQGGAINLEALMAAKPDIIITFNGMTNKDIESANNLQTQTGIPVVMVDHDLQKAPQAYRFLGNLLGLADKCGKLAEYAETALEFASSIDVKENKVKIYYGNGVNSLETIPKGSSHGSLFDLLDAENVANIPGENRGDVSAEQIIGWNPDVIIINGEPDSNITPQQAVTDFKNNTLFKNLNAVKNNRVYAIPKYPYSWFDRPQSANRLIGIYWLADILYDNKVEDINQETKEFYTFFYHIELTDTQVNYLLGKE